jgi:hypothetical protein
MNLKREEHGKNLNATYKIMGTLTLLYRAEALVWRDNVMNGRPQPQIKFLRTVERQTKTIINETISGA